VVEHCREREQPAFEGIALHFHDELDQLIHVGHAAPLEVCEHFPEQLRLCVKGRSRIWGHWARAKASPAADQRVRVREVGRAAGTQLAQLRQSLSQESSAAPLAIFVLIRGRCGEAQAAGAQQKLTRGNVMPRHHAETLSQDLCAAQRGRMYELPAQRRAQSRGGWIMSVCGIRELSSPALPLWVSRLRHGCELGSATAVRREVSHAELIVPATLQLMLQL